MYDPTRIRSVQSPIIPVIGDLVRATPGAISLGQGVVHWPPPREALDAVARYGHEPKDHLYCPVGGIAPLLDALEKKLWHFNKIKVPPASRLVVTAGGNMAFMNALLGITDPGDEIILNAPYYFNHHMAIILADCKPVIVPTDDQFQLQPDLIRDAITERTRAIVTISPNNPTGAIYPEESLYDINQLCRDASIYHISDEAYEYFTFDGSRHFSPGSIAEAADYTISLFSLSKSHGMAAWRIGYMVIPEHLLAAIRKIQDTILICPPVISQIAAVGALSSIPDYPVKQVAQLAPIRTMVQNALRDISDFVHVPPTPGAFYYFLKILTDIPALPLAERLVRQHKVALIPGSTFGATDATYLRLACAALPPPTLREALTRLSTGLKEILA